MRRQNDLGLKPAHRFLPHIHVGLHVLVELDPGGGSPIHRLLDWLGRYHSDQQDRAHDDKSCDVQGVDYSAPLSSFDSRSYRRLEAADGSPMYRE